MGSYRTEGGGGGGVKFCPWIKTGGGGLAMLKEVGGGEQKADLRFSNFAAPPPLLVINDRSLNMKSIYLHEVCRSYLHLTVCRTCRGRHRR